MSAMQSRTLSAWCVVNGGGHPFLDTVRALRGQAIRAYGGDDGEMYREDRRRDGVQVVRCTITTEVNPPADKRGRFAI